MPLLDYFGDAHAIAAFEAKLREGARPGAKRLDALIGLAWHLRQRDTAAALGYADEAAAILAALPARQAVSAHRGPRQRALHGVPGAGEATSGTGGEIAHHAGEQSVAEAFDQADMGIGAQEGPRRGVARFEAGTRRERCESDNPAHSAQAPSQPCPPFTTDSS